MRPGLRLPRLLALCVVLALLATATTSCSSNEGDGTTLDVLASSELADMKPLLDDLRRDTGVRLRMDYRGTVDASNGLTPGRYHHDLAWLSSDRWFQLKLKGAGSRVELPLSQRTMFSPVVIGMKRNVADRLRRGTKDGQISWADVADASAAGSLRFAMADPRRTNSGLAALVGVATAAAGTGKALRLEDVSCDRLRGFFAGQALTEGSTTALADTFVQRQGELDALITYESSLLSLNADGRLGEPLEVVYPKDGMVLSDYPLLLLDPAKRAAYDKVVAWLRSDPVQKKIMERTLRRPLDTSVPRDPRLRHPVGNALYFPDRQEVVDRLLADYGGAGKAKPARVIFLLDFSGSMKGVRMAELRATFDGLGGADDSRSGKFVRFYQGETLTVLRFGSRVLDQRSVTYRGQRDLDALRSFIASGDVDGATAVWSALDAAYDQVAGLVREDPGRPVSILLMTDGESNAGMGLDAFVRRYEARPAAVRAVRTFTVRYGEAGTAELDRAARTTGGRMVDATTGSLLDAFKETRGCVH
ncbi:VWA domain-containing protein [Streptomyces syringium]|uniref:substrate-binding and vWA domain-containing protein n=1 Tax=Streptomyces syringium TaxID=76729 RepID=UPI0034174BA7